MQSLLCLKASAGSGKTFALAKRYIALLYKGAKPSQILAVTFTNKAANEMKDRIIKYLINLEKEKAFLVELAKEIGVNEEEILNRKDELLKTFLTSDIHITTMDAFFQKIARQFGYFGGVSVDFEMGSDRLEDIFDLFLERLSQKHYDMLLRLAQRRENGNFTKFFEGLYEKDKELPLLVFEPFEVDLDKYERKIEVLQDDILSMIERCSDTAKNLIKKEMEEFFKSKVIARFEKEGTLQYSRSYFNKCHSSTLDKKFADLVNIGKEYLYLKYRQIELEILQTIFALYNDYKQIKWQVKKDENYLDFLDVKLLAYDLLYDHIHNDFLYFRLDSKIDHILIDEFQDTSFVEWKIFEPIVEEIASQKSNRTFFYVGDTKQAIYRFKGGRSELFDYVYYRFKPNGMKIDELKTNYRSDKNIVHFVNELFDLHEIPNSQKEGYVSLRRIEANWKESLKEIVEKLLSYGIDPEDIAILVYKNNEVIEVAEFLRSELSLSTQTSSSRLMIHQPSAAAVISLLKYMYYGEKAQLFKFNFLTAIGKCNDEKIELPQKDEPAKMIKWILDHYALWDKATVKLLEYALGFSDLIEFVYNVDSSTIEMGSDVRGIQVMTIHKSKGLEFEHVIVMDQMGSNNNQKDLLIYDYEDVHLKNIRYRQSIMATLDPSYVEVLKKEKELEEKDLKNLEYVAYTRAKRSLIILQKAKDSNLLQLAKKGIEAFEKGTIDSEKERKKESNPKPLKVELKDHGRQSIVEEEEYKPNDYAAIYKGEALHTLFEMNEPTFILNHYGVFTDIDEVVELYEKAKNFEPYRILLKGELKREIGFVHQKLRGQIDLLVEGKEITIIDYKSTKPHDEHVYLKQVRFYMDAARTLFKKPVRGYLFYLDSLELREVK